MAKRLTACVREDDTVARMGGDEFTVILAGATCSNGVALVARKMIDALAMPFPTPQQPIRISASIGIAFYPRDASSPVALLEAADKAMYKAKKSGSNRMSFSETADDTGRAGQA